MPITFVLFILINLLMLLKMFLNTCFFICPIGFPLALINDDVFNRLSCLNGLNKPWFSTITHQWCVTRTQMLFHIGGCNAIHASWTTCGWSVVVGSQGSMLVGQDSIPREVLCRFRCIIFYPIWLRIRRFLDEAILVVSFRQY